MKEMPITRWTDENDSEALGGKWNKIFPKQTTKIEVIIIMSRRLRGYPWPSLAISPYHSSPPAGPQGYIPCPHIAAVCKFVLVVPLLHIHVWGSTGVHRLWARPCFSSSVLRVWFVELVWFLWWGTSVRIVGVSWGVVARTCLILLSTFLHNFRPASSPAAS